MSAEVSYTITWALDPSQAGAFSPPVAVSPRETLRLTDMLNSLEVPGQGPDLSCPVESRGWRISFRYTHRDSAIVSSGPCGFIKFVVNGKIVSGARAAPAIDDEVWADAHAPSDYYPVATPTPTYAIFPVPAY